MTVFAWIAGYLAIGASAIFILNLVVEPWKSPYSFERGKASDGWWMFNIAMFLAWPLAAPFGGAIAYAKHVRSAIKAEAEKAYGDKE